MVVVAMPNECDLINTDESFLITGIGALNVYNALKDIPRDTPILNVGYAGSNVIEIGKRVSIGKVSLYHPSVDYIEPIYQLDGDILCYTSCNFVTHTDIEEPCVFDMELAFILGMGFTNVRSEKIISDNLSMEEFEECLKK